MTLLPPPDNNEREEIMDETSVTSCDGRIHNSLIIVVNQVIKFFKVIGWFSGNIVGSFLFGQNNILLVLQMVTNKLSQIMISQKNAEAASITIGDVGFYCIRRFHGGSYFSTMMIEILCNRKRKCILCGGELHDYTLKELQYLTTL